MKIGESEVNFELFELPEDYKFVYKIEGCEHKLDFDTNTVVDKILSTRTKIVDKEVIRQLRNIGEEKGINELILIDESKVLKIVNDLKALEIIKNRLVDTHDIVIYTFSEFNYRRSQRGLLTISKEEYDLIKECLKQ